MKKEQKSIIEKAYENPMDKIKDFFNKVPKNKLEEAKALLSELL